MTQNKLEYELSIEASGFNQYPELETWLKTAISNVEKTVNLIKAPIGEIGIMLTSDIEVQKLNHKFRYQNKPTNVLSFPAEADEHDALFASDELPYLGDIAMAFETLEREAQAQNKKIEHHFIHLIIHSILHLLGYDHILEHEAQAMEAIEIDILATIDIENPYL